MTRIAEAGIIWRALLVLVLVATVMAPAWASDDAGSSEGAPQGSSSGSSDDVETQGQVLGINSLALTPIVLIGNLDGIVTLYFLNVDHLAQSGIQIGDHISVVGQKINEFEFTVGSTRVDKRPPLTPVATNVSWAPAWVLPVAQSGEAFNAA